MHPRTTLSLLILALIIALVVVGCRPIGQATPPPEETAIVAAVEQLPTLLPAELASGERLRVVATTTIVSDVVAAVGGDAIALTSLLGANADPHAFEPTPRDASAIASAHVLFVHGLELEEFLTPLMANVGDQVPVVPVTAGIVPLASGPIHEEHQKGAENHQNEGYDPHTWTAVSNVMVWTDVVMQALATLDPARSETYRANADAYQSELKELDAWIREQVAQIPESRRLLVTDHLAFGYLAHAYGFEQVGAVFPGYSSLTQPSAQELAQLEDAIRAKGVPAVFVGLSVNPSLAERVAQDTGIRLVFLYTGALSEPGGPADSYLKLMRYNITAIVEALR